MKNALKLLDFTATWCGPCQAMKPVLAKFEAAHPEVEVVAIDIDHHEALCRQYEIECVPTFVVEQGGQAVARSSGSCALRDLEALLPHPAAKKRPAAKKAAKKPAKAKKAKTAAKKKTKPAKRKA